MVCYQALGNDVTIAAAAEAGQLELNVMMPVIAHNLLLTMRILTTASRVFAERCVEGIEADRAQSEYWLERSPALVTALAPGSGTPRRRSSPKRRWRKTSRCASW